MPDPSSSDVSKPYEPSRLEIWGLAVYLFLTAALALWVCYLAKCGADIVFVPCLKWPPCLSPLLHIKALPGVPYFIYALAWGAIGGCVSAGMAAGKHLAARDFERHWLWWYVAKPAAGGVIGAVTYVLCMGVGTIMGANFSVKNGYGVAAIAFLAGFAVERAILKFAEVAKEIFKTDPSTDKLTILEPATGHVVSGAPTVRVVVDVPGNPRYITATCLQDPSAPTTLARMGNRTFAGDVPIAGAKPGALTIHAAASVGDLVLTNEVVITLS